MHSWWWLHRSWCNNGSGVGCSERSDGGDGGISHGDGLAGLCMMVQYGTFSVIMVLVGKADRDLMRLLC